MKLAAAAALLAALTVVQTDTARALFPTEDEDASGGFYSHSRPIEEGCVLLDSLSGTPRFAAGAGACAGAAARGSFLPGRHAASGWAQLSISTDGAYTDEQQALALGFLEGWLTAMEIWYHRHNVGAHFNLTADAPALGWLEEQDEWTRRQAARNSSAFWAAMRLLHAQMDGMQDGYTARAEHERQLASQRGEGRARGDRPPPPRLPPLGRRDFLFLSAVGDYDPLREALGSRDHGAAAADRRWASLSPHGLLAELHSAGRCSALVRVTPDFSDLLMGHSAWFTFGGMVRIYKHYSLQLHHPALRLRRMSFSSYPGELSSDDDFCLLSTGLVVLQTTNSVFNKTLYSLLSPESVLSWQRARIASFLADDGRGWTDVMPQHNSGTGNNQWMVVDLKLFKPGHELPPGLLWVVEQMPGLVVASDQTGTLERGYWPSYNIPFHPEVYSGSGYPQFLAQQAQRGADYAAAAVAGASYQMAPRAQIFRRDAPHVDHLPGLRSLLRSNRWPEEPFSAGSPLGALCGRGDVDPLNPRAAGCYDSKATTWALARRFEADAVVGPTHTPAMPPFAWSASGPLEAAVAHLGQPDAFAFEFERMAPDPALWRWLDD
ncbi:hypothetical protein ABPG77_009487 [Micractinium sp. CCAP 211/92]